MKTDNELIAEFMGLQVYSNYEEVQAVPIEKLTAWVYPHQANQYEKDWSWLMPVVEKISEMEFAINIYSKNDTAKVTIHEGRNINGHIGEPIIKIDKSRDGYCTQQTIYVAVVEFIKWYNSQNNKEWWMDKKNWKSIKS